MRKIFAKEIAFERIVGSNTSIDTFPYLRFDCGDKEMWSISPIHGRSFVVGHKDGRSIVSKGNGLAYTTHNFIFTPEMPSDVWGLLLKEDALRDYYCGQDVKALGVKTNQMECVIELDYPIYIRATQKWLKPVLLQYSVSCPYRIADAAFMSYELILNEVKKWDSINANGYDKYHLIAADVLINSIKIVHDNGILHNALTYENITWALELLDFEIAHTPQHPYTHEDYIRHVPTLMDREILDIYKIVLYIAGVLRETLDFKIIDSLFKSYGFDLSSLSVGA